MGMKDSQPHIGSLYHLRLLEATVAAVKGEGVQLPVSASHAAVSASEIPWLVVEVPLVLSMFFTQGGAPELIVSVSVFIILYDL